MQYPAIDHKSWYCAVRGRPIITSFFKGAGSNKKKNKGMGSGKKDDGDGFIHHLKMTSLLDSPLLDVIGNKVI